MPAVSTTHHRFALVLLTAWLLLEAALAFNVVDRLTWALENGMAVVCIGLLVLV